MTQEFSLIYPANVKQDGDKFTVTFRDLVNVFTEGNTYEEALFNAQEVLDILLLDMAQDEMAIPEPSACKQDEVPITVSPDVTAPILLNKLRLSRHCSMADVARTMGVSYQNYQQMESGKNMTLKSLKKAAAALGAVVEIRLHVPT